MVGSANDSDEISTAKAEPDCRGGLSDGRFGPQGEQYAGLFQCTEDKENKWDRSVHLPFG
jgi:hypothetical protein